MIRWKINQFGYIWLSKSFSAKNVIYDQHSSCSWQLSKYTNSTICQMWYTEFICSAYGHKNKLQNPERAKICTRGKNNTTAWNMTIPTFDISSHFPFLQLYLLYFFLLFFFTIFFPSNCSYISLIRAFIYSSIPSISLLVPPFFLLFPFLISFQFSIERYFALSWLFHEDYCESIS